MTTHKKLLIHLLLADGVGPVFIYRALSALSGIKDQAEVIHHYVKHHDELARDLQVLFDQKPFDLVAKGICSASVAEKLKKSLSSVDTAQEFQDIQNSSVSVDSCFDEEYPELLRHIYAPPVLLYRRGRVLTPDQQFLSVVGSRSATTYGLSCVKELLPAAARAGCNLVSGGAVGIDTAVHRIALDCGASTTVVLGSGLLQLYPYANKSLFEELVAQGGTLLSPFSMRQRPERGTFPARNRVIAGLSSVCLVIEASAKSGALITASYALDSGRTVCAVPGSIFSETSQGSHELLRKGAVLVSSAQDVLRELGYVTDLGNVMSDENVPEPVRGELAQENNFFLFLSRQPRSEEEIADFLQKTIQETQDFLFDLQLEGKIQQQFTGLWGLSGR